MKSKCEICKKNEVVCAVVMPVGKKKKFKPYSEYKFVYSCRECELSLLAQYCNRSNRDLTAILKWQGLLAASKASKQIRTFK